MIDAIGVDSDAGIFVFGAIISRLPGGETLRRTPLEPSVVARLVEHFHGRGYPVLALFDTTEAGVDYQLIEGERHTAIYERWLSMSPTTVQRCDGWTPTQVAPVRIGVIDDPAHIKETVAGLNREFSAGEIKFNPIYAPNYDLHVVECFAPQVNKWYGIQQVAGAMKIDASQVVAIGDDVNDMEMIEHAGLSVAMGNAIEPIKQMADVVAPTNDEAGVAVTINAILDGQWNALRKNEGVSG